MSMMRELLMARQQKKEIWLQSSTSDSDAAFIGVLYNNGLCKSPDVIYLDEAASITTMPSLDSIKDVYEGGDWSPLVNCSTFKGNFKGFTELTYIKFPSDFASNITNTDIFFSGAQKLKNIVFGNNSFCNVTKAYRMFQYLTALETIDMPNNFISKANAGQEYNTGVFQGCTSIKSLVFPDNFAVNSTDFGYLLYGTSSLKSVRFGQNFGKNITNIWRFCSGSGIEELVFPDGFGSKITTFDDSIASSYLKKIVFPDNCGIIAELGYATGVGFLCDMPSLEEVHFGQGFGNSATRAIGRYIQTSFLSSCNKLHTITGLNLPNVTKFTLDGYEDRLNAIGGSALTNVTAVKLPKCSFSFSASPLLTEDSLRSIINALNDEPLEGAKLRLHATAKARLQAMSDYDTLLSSATSKGWTIA